MIYLSLFWGFFKVGLFTFGGGYASIPLLRDLVLGNGWLTEEAFWDMVAVSESTPGPIMVNLATYTGSVLAGFPGSLVATLAVVLPAFLIILLLAALLKKAIHHPLIKAILSGLEACALALILGTGVLMVLNLSRGEEGIRVSSLLLLGLLLLVSFVYKKLRGKELTTLTLLFLAALAGCLWPL